MEEVKEQDSATSATSTSSSASDEVKSSASADVSSSATNSSKSTGVYVPSSNSNSSNYATAGYGVVTAPKCGKDSYINDSYFNYVDRVILEIVLRDDEQYTKDEVVNKIKDFKGGL